MTVGQNKSGSTPRLDISYLRELERRVSTLEGIGQHTIRKGSLIKKIPVTGENTGDAVAIGHELIHVRLHDFNDSSDHNPILGDTGEILVLDRNGYPKAKAGYTVPIITDSILQHNLSAILPPTVINDSTEGYGVGSYWLVVTTNRLYVCFDDTEDTAIWEEVQLADNWHYQIPITIDSSKIDSDLAMFPVTVYLKGSDFDFTHCRPDGRDIVFLADDLLTKLPFEKIHFGHGYYSTQCTVAAGHGNQGLTGDDTHFFWGKDNGVGVDATIYKVTHAGVDVANFAGPSHCQGMDIRETRDTLLASGAAGTEEVWEIEKDGTKLREWDFSGIDYAGGMVISIDEDTILWHSQDGTNFRLREIIIHDDGTYDLGSVWEHELLGTHQGLEYKDGYVWLLYDTLAGPLGIALAILELNPDGTITIIDTFDTDLDTEEAEGLCCIDDVFYFGNNAVTIRKWERIAFFNVMVPHVDAGSDVTFYMRYGKADAQSEEDKEAVYDNGFLSAWNLIEKGAAELAEFKDSTKNRNHGQGGAGTAANCPSRTQGSLYKGQLFNDSHFIDIVDQALGDVPMDIVGPVTIEALVSFETTGNKDCIFSKAESSGYSLDKNTTDEARFYIHTGGAYVIADGNGALSANTLYYIVGTYDRTNVKLYVNGVLQTDQPAATGYISTNDYNASIGSNPGATRGEYWDGRIEMVRISDICRSAAWIKAAYNGFVDSLLTFGSEEEI